MKILKRFTLFTGLASWRWRNSTSSYYTFDSTCAEKSAAFSLTSPSTFSLSPKRKLKSKKKKKKILSNLMGQQQSKEELLYRVVSYGNIERIKDLRRDGAGLEWRDEERKTPLIMACMSSDLYNAAKTLIELGANVNAYRPGHSAGTPLHHAIGRGLEETVKLLLSHGAIVLMMNDDHKTPLHVVRSKGFTNIVRAIESHVCLFSNSLHELYDPGCHEILAPQLPPRKVWVVVLPCGFPGHNFSPRELAIYTNAQDAQPRTIVALCNAKMEEPDFSQPDPTVIITCNSKKRRIKLAAANESDKQQLLRFFNACNGIPQVAHPAFPLDAQVNVPPATAPPEDVELDVAIDASLQSPVHPDLGIHPVHPQISVPASIPSATPVVDTAAGASSSCVICLDAPIEAACIPCGHVAGCMSCLSEIKAKKWGCPVCRAKIDQVTRLHTV